MSCDEFFHVLPAHQSYGNRGDGAKKTAPCARSRCACGGSTSLRAAASRYAFALVVGGWVVVDQRTPKGLPCISQPNEEHGCAYRYPDENAECNVDGSIFPFHIAHIAIDAAALVIA